MSQSELMCLQEDRYQALTSYNREEKHTHREKWGMMSTYKQMLKKRIQIRRKMVETEGSKSYYPDFLIL